MSPAPEPSRTHAVIIPSYNAGSKLVDTVNSALKYWKPVWVVVDGSTDRSDEPLADLQKQEAGLRVVRLPVNSGKGAAVLTGMEQALQEGFQFALVMDSDGQHPANRISDFMRASQENPSAMILGKPDFGPEAPVSRTQGRRVGNWWTNLETMWGGIHDSLFGFRVYPLRESVNVMKQTRGGRRFDFDTVIAVRLFWAGVLPINVPVSVRYFTAEEGGVSHFRYVRDNLLLIARHTGLVVEMIPQLQRIWKYRQRALKAVASLQSSNPQSSRAVPRDRNQS